MPPKVAPVAAAPPPSKNFKIDVRVRTDNDNESKFRIRFFSEWLNCCGTTAVFGQGEPPWDVIPESNKKQCSYQNSFEASLNKQDSLNLFNSKPGVYAVVVKEIVENGFIISVPVGFSYIDCSSLAFEKNKLSVLNVLVDNNIELDFSITVETALIPKVDIIAYEPLILNLTRYAVLFVGRCFY